MRMRMRVRVRVLAETTDLFSAIQQISSNLFSPGFSVGAR